MDGSGSTWRIERFEEIGSTNRYLLDAADSGSAPGAVAVTGFQSAGRGRLDRRWETEPGDALLFSVLVAPDLADVAGRAMGLAVVEAVDAGAVLKWPNDVLVGDRKLAGILAESTTTGGVLSAVVVGCGLNVRSVPAGLEEQATFVDRHRRAPVDTDGLLDDILRALGRWLERPELVAEAYRSRCSTIGRRVDVSTVGETVTGVAQTVGDDGSLMLLTDAGETCRMTLGEVVRTRPVPE